MSAQAAFISPCSISLSRRTLTSSPLCHPRPFTAHLRPRLRTVSCIESPQTQREEETLISAASSAPGEDYASTHHSKKIFTAESARDSVAADVVWTIGWICVAAAAAGGIAWTKGADLGLEFVTAYVVEYSLSVDNLFVFLLIFSYFGVERHAQLRVLTYGIAGAMLMRGVMIVVGEALTHRFRAVTVGFAGLLLYSAGSLLFGSDEDEDEDLEKNNIVRFSRKLLPFTDRYEGNKFFTKKNGVTLATPLMLVLLCVEFSDIVFALDSVPAVLGISDDSVVIYLSNILAIMGLRNLFFVLSDAIGDLRFLRQALAIVLGFVGGKMLANVAGFRIDIIPSLTVVIGTLAAGVGLSLAFPEPEPEPEPQPVKEVSKGE